jgi:hypothetical protein
VVCIVAVDRADAERGCRFVQNRGWVIGAFDLGENGFDAGKWGDRCAALFDLYVYEVAKSIVALDLSIKCLGLIVKFASLELCRG